MARIQELFENTKPEHVEEGPWLLCGPFRDGSYRVERVYPDFVCSCYPMTLEHQDMMKRAFAEFGLTVKRSSVERLTPVVDSLNKAEKEAPTSEDISEGLLQTITT